MFSGLRHSNNGDMMKKFWESSLRMQMKMLKYQRENTCMLRQLLQQMKNAPKRSLKSSPLKKVEPANTPEELEALANDENVVSFHNSFNTLMLLTIYF